MGWKSTIDISRTEAIRLVKEHAKTLSNKELEDLLPALGYGDDVKLPYYGLNFIVLDDAS
jgi:hypothetical protein